jgi:uncharacterized protein HemY
MRGLHRDHHDPDGEADTLDSLGYNDHRSGHHAQALTLYRAHGNTFRTANTLERLGHPHAALGQTEQARTVCTPATRSQYA